MIMTYFKYTALYTAFLRKKTEDPEGWRNWLVEIIQWTQGHKNWYRVDKKNDKYNKKVTMMLVQLDNRVIIANFWINQDVWWKN